MTHPSVLHGHRAGDDRIAHRALEGCLERRAAGAADVRIETLKQAETRVPRRAHGDALVVQVDDAADVELRFLPDKPHLLHTHRVPIECARNRRRVAQAIVEEAEVQTIDGCVHQQLVYVAELSDDSDVAAGDCRRER